MDAVAWIVLVIFTITYIAISSERVNRTAMAMVGLGIIGVILVATNTSTFTDLVEHIEWHTILFVTAMYVIVAVAGASGMFQYMAITLAKPSQGDTRKLFVTLLVFVFIISLFFDTTSTMLIMAPLTIELCKALEIDFKPFLISEAIVCNFASIPSVVGAVPNLVIADETRLDAGFMFIVLMPLSIIIFLVILPLLLRVFNNKLVDSDAERAEDVFSVDPTLMIRSRNDFYMSVLAIIALVLGFTVGQGFGVEPAMVAILVAFTMLLVSGERVNQLLAQIGWGTIFFLVGIFGLVAGLAVTGIINEIGVLVGDIIGENIPLAIVFLTWIPALLSAVIDNIPVSVVLAPIAIQFMTLTPLLPLVLVFAVNIGGFILPIGCPANILALAMAEKEHDPISLADFAKIATPLGLLILAIGTGWLLLISMLI